MNSYLARLAGEAQLLHHRFPSGPETVYFGGGTPSFLRERELELLFESLPWKLAGSTEVTMEANPGTLNRERLSLLRDLGVTRLSLGVQSFQDPVLKTLGRAHGRKGALRAAEEALEAGFRTSLDLILGLPGQDVAADLRQAAEIGAGHVSAYTLQLEPGTPFALSGIKLDPELEAAALEQAENTLAAAGFVRYEVSNFALPGEECRHNQIYWQTGFWGALGPGAVGHLPPSLRGAEGGRVFSVRTTNPPLPRWLQGELAGLEQISIHEHLKEALMMGLRTQKGLDVAELESRVSLSVWHSLRQTAEELASQGLLTIEGSKLRPTERGMSLLHPVILRLWSALPNQEQ